MATIDDFHALDIRVWCIVSAEVFPEARKPAYKLMIDFGPEIGIKKSSAQITARYVPHELVGARMLAIINFPPRQVGKFLSEVLTLAAPDEWGEWILLKPERDTPLGGRIQ